jgi:membrane-bound inhibitor of C-type lysozyme
VVQAAYANGRRSSVENKEHVRMQDEMSSWQCLADPTRLEIVGNHVDNVGLVRLREKGKLVGFLRSISE